MLRQRKPQAREQAGQTAREIAALMMRLHGALIEAALAEAGLPGRWPRRAVRRGQRRGQLRRAQVRDAAPRRRHLLTRGRSREVPGLRLAHPRLRVYVDKGSACGAGNATSSRRTARAGAGEDGAAVRQMEVVGVRVEMPTNNPIVLLKETQGERYLPIWIGPKEATAIAFAQQGMVPAAAADT